MNRFPIPKPIHRIINVIRKPNIGIPIKGPLQLRFRSLDDHRHHLQPIDRNLFDQLHKPILHIRRIHHERLLDLILLNRLANPFPKGNSPANQNPLQTLRIDHQDNIVVKNLLYSQQALSPSPRQTFISYDTGSLGNVKEGGRNVLN